MPRTRVYVGGVLVIDQDVREDTTVICNGQMVGAGQTKYLDGEAYPKPASQPKDRPSKSQLKETPR